ncbi:MAG: IS1634 family transposase [Acidobacteria bacterium]|nr:MAG: IS1634 family transposase [Acidobacteriota bacterium]
MYIESVPNRHSPPAILLRECLRRGGKVVKRTLANLSAWPAAQIDSLRRVLKGESLVAPSDAFRIQRSAPHGHVAAALGTLRRLLLEPLLSRTRCPERDLVVALIVARILEPSSKLATSRGLHPDTATSSLAAVLGLDAAIEESQLYHAMDWLLLRQQKIENALAKRHLSEGSLILYDVSSTYFEGRHCPLAGFGHSRDERSGNPQIVFGLMTNSQGCPIAVEVFQGNTGDPKTVAPQVQKLRQRFRLKQIVLVGDRGMLTSARIRDDLKTQEGLQWISALKSVQIQTLVQAGALQLSLFDQRDLAEIQHPSYLGERLIACRNPLLAEERSRKRKELLEATQKQLDKIVAATQRKKKPLRGRQEIGLRVGRILGRYKMGKHFRLFIEDDGFRCERKTDHLEREAALDGIYVIRTSVPAQTLSSEKVVGCYKGLSDVERAFRSLKSVDLKIRPIYPHLADRVRAHIFLCMLAYYVEWHMRQALAPVLFDEDDPEAAEAARRSLVSPAQRSPKANSKDTLKRTGDGLPVHSFQTLLKDLATLTMNQVRIGDQTVPMAATPTPVQQRALDLLQVSASV